MKDQNNTCKHRIKKVTCMFGDLQVDSQKYRNGKMQLRGGVYDGMFFDVKRVRLAFISVTRRHLVNIQGLKCNLYFTDQTLQFYLV